MPTRTRRKPPVAAPQVGGPACRACVGRRAEVDRVRAGIKGEKAKRKAAEKESDRLAFDNAKIEHHSLELLDWIDRLTRENDALRDELFRRTMRGTT